VSKPPLTRTSSPQESPPDRAAAASGGIGAQLTQHERDGLEAWLRWGQLPDEQLLERAMQKVPVQLAFDRVAPH